MPHSIIEANRQRDLYLVDGDRIVYAPKGWCDDMRQDDEDGPCFACYYGNPDVLAFRSRENQEYLTTDCIQQYGLDTLAAMREVTEVEARQIDPDLFTLLDAINNGEAK